MRFLIQSPPHRAFDESETTLRIARAAKHVFLKSGGSSFSMRTVAKEAAMSVGALQHFYPKRDKLLAAMLEFVVNEYEEAYDRVFSSLPFNGEARLLGAIEYLCSDIQRQETRAFFFALLALSCHNKLAAGIVSDMYSHHVRNLAAFVGAARPELSEERCHELALQIAAIVEGFMVFTAPGAQQFPSKSSLAETTKRAVLDLLDAPRTGRARRV
jgi:AcrR family transcriptional regulator